jgi:hypothetical protein
LQTSKKRTAARAPSRAARVRAFATAALGAADRPTSRGAPVVGAADGAGKEAALRIAEQQMALENAMRDLQVRHNHKLDPEEKAVIRNQIAMLGEAMDKLGGKRIEAEFDDEHVQEALRRLAEITGSLQKEARVLRTATNLVASVAKVLGFVEEGLKVLVGAGLLV